MEREGGREGGRDGEEEREREVTPGPHNGTKWAAEGSGVRGRGGVIPGQP